MAEPAPALAVHGLRKAFGGLTATDDVSLDLRPGEIHALIGPNGAGKSTLIGQIAGWIAPDAGRIELGGRDVTALDVAARARRGLGRSFQVSSLAAPLSARRNAMIAAQARQGSSFRFLRPVAWDRALREAADAALDRVGLLARAGVPAAELSHGERRLLEVACALALGPKALLLDEPMAGLGMEGSAQLGDLLETLKTEAPILLVEHDMDAVFRLADRISVLVAGRVIASGSVEEIRADAEVRRAYLGED
ncbi:ABC transporter ATP-binding protein [Albimonas sp. CAU 1670]|uniref:ABC transporter ATP-binding protein n=1 Tax=Albimonas sp. CAU 1670 TaxID=3032599 RepID=UPI0023DC4E44|nr:ABC transporter ATP-binding protein [Albimonas sp. CAU 1670]MDF2235825.1 ABC transporter ATP-binding protein [Albimonas sp. CAU 1670]